ncbi:MAG: hypothetical protein HY059_09665 [Proteobacteria bacterium]|nr:hypothetical protein [Pseudomonadota bacterium]
MKLALLVSIALASSVASFAGEPHHAAAPASKDFEFIKSLAGTWKGETTAHGKKEQTISVFKVTSGGSAVVETMSPGTEHEMTNVYHVVDGKLMMTHYCAIGNAPQMRIVSSDAKSVSLKGIKANGIDPKSTPHMHSLTYALADKDHLKATWTSANMGKEHDGPSTFEYTRAP